MEVVECKRCGRSRPVQTGAALGESCPYCLMMFMFADDEVSADDAEAGPAQLPERLGPYRLLEPLGAGGMGTVYRAQHEALDRTVALKVLRPEFAARAGFRERFQHEARILASLTHPHIVGIHDTGCDGGIYYLAMEYVAGTTLRAKLEASSSTATAGSLPIEEAVRIVAELCTALDYAHDRGVIHRDLKPENVLLAADGRAKIVDFGVAKLLAVEETTRTPVTEVDTVVGTRRYMAPEQLEPGRAIDRRADLYSLAAVLYEMLTGEAPLGVFAPPSAKVPAAAPLDKPILDALAKDPNARPPSAQAFRRSLDDARRPKTAPRTRRWVLIGAAATALTAIAIAPFQRRFNASPDAQESFGGRRLRHPTSVWRSLFTADGASLITACGDRQVRSWPTAGGEPTVMFAGFPHGELGYLSMAASPDSTALVTAGGDNVARVWDLKSRGERFTLVGHNREIVDTAWSADGTLIATAAHDKSVRLWNAADGTSVAVFDALPDPALCVSFSPDGKLLAAGIMNGAIKVWDVAAHTLRGGLGHQKRVWSLAFGAAGDGVLRMVSGSHDRTLKVWTFEPDGTVKPKPAAREIQAGGEVWSVAVSPRGDLMAVGLNDGTLSLRTFPEGQPFRTLKEHTASIVEVSFSDDGAKLATSSLDGSAIVWDVARLVS